MMNSRLVWRNVCNWMVVAIAVSVLTACGGGAKSSQPSVNAQVEAVGTVAYGQSSSFRITGNNLRNAIVTINDPVNTDRCTDYVEKIKTNTEIVITCTPYRLKLNFSVLDNQGLQIKSLSTTLPDPGIRIDAITSAADVKLGAVTKFTIFGDQLELIKQVFQPSSENCLVITPDLEASTINRIEFTCIPIALDLSFTLSAQDGRTIGTKTVTLPSTTKKEPLQLTVESDLTLNQTNTFIVTGYLGGAKIPKVNVATSADCSDLTTLRSNEVELIFSCTLKKTTALFDLKDEKNVAIETLPLPIKKVEFQTSEGSFVVALNAEKAPITVKNFLIYVSKQYYDNTIFHRVVSGFVNQGGGFTTKADLLSNTAKPGLRPAITLESTDITGLSNTVNTIAMARTSDPNSATSQFFFNVVDNSSSLDFPSSNSPGYAVFGTVESGEAVLQDINGVATSNLFGNQGVPDSDVIINSVAPVVGTDGTF